MADSNQGQKFLEALIRYIDFRFKETDGKHIDKPPGYIQLMQSFKELLRSRPGGDPKREIYQALVANMDSMKDSRGGGQPPPHP